MSLYLVKGTVQIGKYGTRNYEQHEEVRLVEANSAGEAHAKFEKHFEGMTNEYCVYYTVLGTEAHAIIT